MGRIYWLVQGLWVKGDNGEWSFEEVPTEQPETIIINYTDSFDGVVERTRITLNLGVLTPVVLTYQQPDWMLLPDAATTPPQTLLCDNDVEIMANIREYMTDPFLFVTSGPEPVAKYTFQRRYPFTVGGKTFLENGVTEEQHRQDIKDLVDGHPIVCSKHMLEIMFNEPQLLIVFHVALEIEMVYANIDHDGSDLPRITGEDVIELGEGAALSLDDPSNYDPYDEVLYGEPMPLEELARVFPITGDQANGYHTRNGENPLSGSPPRIPTSLGDVNGNASYEVYVHPAPPPSNTATGRPTGSNRRISASPVTAVIVIEDDDDASYTGSSDGADDNVNIITLTPSQPMTQSTGGYSIERNTYEGEKEMSEGTSDIPVVGTELPNASITEPSLELTLAV